MTIDYIEHVESSFKGVNDTLLFSQSWQRKTGLVSGVLIINHGLKDHSSRYSGFAAALTARGFTVYGYDLRGHGRSGGPPVYIDNFQEYVEDLATFANIVRGNHPGLPLFLFGHSMGGTIALTYTLKNQSGVKGLVLSSPAITPGSGVSPLLITLTRLLGSTIPHLPLMNLPDKQFSHDSLTVESIAADPFIHHEKGPAKLAAQLLAAMKYPKTHMNDLSIPVLILHGTADLITNPDGSKMLSEKASSSDKTLKLYGGLYHDLLHEPEKDTVLRDISSWLEAHVASPLKSK